MKKKSEFRIGDTVTVKTDLPWSIVLGTGDRVRRANSNKIRTFKVLAVNCSILLRPNKGSVAPVDTLILSNDSKQEIIGINTLNLEICLTNIEIQYVVNGQIITNQLSAESKYDILVAYKSSHSKKTECEGGR